MNLVYQSTLQSHEWSCLGHTTKPVQSHGCHSNQTYRGTLPVAFLPSNVVGSVSCLVEDERTSGCICRVVCARCLAVTLQISDDIEGSAQHDDIGIVVT